MAGLQEAVENERSGDLNTFPWTFVSAGYALRAASSYCALYRANDCDGLMNELESRIQAPEHRPSGFFRSRIRLISTSRRWTSSLAARV